MDIYGNDIWTESLKWRHPCATVSFTQYRRHAVHNSTLNQAHLATRKTPHDMSAEHLCLPLFVHVNLNCVLFPTHTAVYLLTTLLLKKHTNEYEGMITTRASNSLGHCQNYLGVSENSVPLKPMVNDHYPYEMAIIGIYPIFRQTHMHTMHSHRILISLSIPSPNGVPRPSCLALGALKLQHNPQVPSCQSPVHVPQLRGLCQIDSTLVAQKKRAVILLN